jgi:hypothetical protein
MAAELGADNDSYDAPLETRIKLLSANSSLEQGTPVPRFTKEELISVHLNNIALLKKSSKSREPKPLILPAAYSPSISSLNELQKVILSFILP